MATQFKTKDSSKQFKRRKKRPCPLTIDQINVLDHNDIDFLKRFISDRGKILPRRNTGVSAKSSGLYPMPSNVHVIWDYFPTVQIKDYLWKLY